MATMVERLKLFSTERLYVCVAVKDLKGCVARLQRQNPMSSVVRLCIHNHLPLSESHW